MTALLAVDAGATHTRAVCIDVSGRVLGLGSGPGANVVARGSEQAVDAIAGAMALAAREASIDLSVAEAAICTAGDLNTRHRAEIAARVGMRGAEALFVIGDAVAGFLSAHAGDAGFVVTVGTGSIVMEVHDATPVRVIDGLGWLLGDTGSGFWIGAAVARAVAADLGGFGPSTALTDSVMSHISTSGADRWENYRSEPVRALMSHVYGGAPIDLASLSAHAFAHEEDAVAAEIVGAGELAVSRMVRVARGSRRELPVVATGSTLLRGYLADHRASGPLRAELADAHMHYSVDGLVGAAVLAIRRAGGATPDYVRARLREQLRRSSAVAVA